MVVPTLVVENTAVSVTVVITVVTSVTTGAVISFTTVFVGLLRETQNGRPCGDRVMYWISDLWGSQDSFGGSPASDGTAIHDSSSSRAERRCGGYIIDVQTVSVVVVVVVILVLMDSRAYAAQYLCE